MKRIVPVAAMSSAIVAVSQSAHAQVIAGGLGGLGGGGLGDQVLNWFYQNFMHALAAAGVLAILCGMLFFRSHITQIAIGGIALICIGNYTTILSWAGL